MTEFDYRISSNIHDDLTIKTLANALQGGVQCANPHSKPESIQLAAALSTK